MKRCIECDKPLFDQNFDIDDLLCDDCFICSVDKNEIDDPYLEVAKENNEAQRNKD